MGSLKSGVVGTQNAVESPIGQFILGATTFGLASAPNTAEESVNNLEGSANIQNKLGSTGGLTAGKRYIPINTIKQMDEENPDRICVFCHMSSETPQKDHARPVVDFGNTTIENMQWTCPHCNTSKGSGLYPKTPPSGFKGIWPPPWWNKIR
jgi:hypothetical protein